MTKGKHITLADRIITDDLADINAFFPEDAEGKTGRHNDQIRGFRISKYRDAGLELDQVEERVSKR